MLSIFGTFLTRSGVVNSVHAFAQSAIGDWFVCVSGDHSGGVLRILYSERIARHLKSEHQLESLISRESSFLFNNLVVAAGLFHGVVGNPVSGAVGVGAGTQGHSRSRRFLTT